MIDCGNLHDERNIYQGKKWIKKLSTKQHKDKSILQVPLKLLIDAVSVISPIHLIHPLIFNSTLSYSWKKVEKYCSIK